MKTFARDKSSVSGYKILSHEVEYIHDHEDPVTDMGKDSPTSTSLGFTTGLPHMTF
jgi:hypothetical protein